MRAGLTQRARIVLLVADRLPNAEIARRTGTSRPTVVGWRARYAEGGIATLQDQPRSGPGYSSLSPTHTPVRPPPARVRATPPAALPGASCQRCRTNYADPGIMPMWALFPLRGNDSGLVRSA